MASTNGGNYNRVIRQRAAYPTMCIGVALPTAAASWLLAMHVATGAGAGFYDVWLGIVSGITGLGATCAAIVGIIEAINAVQKTIED